MLYRGYIGIIMLYWGTIGRMEKKMEPAIEGLWFRVLGRVLGLRI